LQVLDPPLRGNLTLPNGKANEPLAALFMTFSTNTFLYIFALGVERL